MSDTVYAPNVHLFAFHSGNGSINHLRSHTDFEQELLWHKCNDIFAQFQINQELRLKHPSDEFRVPLLEGSTDSVGIFLPLEGKVFHKEQKHRLTGCVCPLKIGDSYALALNLRIPEVNERGQKTDDLEVSFFQSFNRDQCFLPQEIHSSLGQTVLLTAWLSQKQQQGKMLWRDIADKCVQNFLGEDFGDYPPLYQSGQLFGSPIFEYGNPYKPLACGQIFVWLFVREAFNGQVNSRLDNNFGFFYQKFIDLCLYRQKIITAYHQALEAYAEINQRQKLIKEIINTTATVSLETNELKASGRALGLSDAEMKYFKDKLGILPKIALDYAEGIQTIEGCRLVIEANTKNYAEKIRQIQERLSNYDLSFLSVFNQKISVNFQDDIKAKLADCGYGSSLADKAIASIRGIVEIDKAQRDRTLEESLHDNGIAAQEREKKFQIWFALIVACLAISSISSQVSSPARTVLNYLKPEQSSGSPLASFAHFFLYNFYDVLIQTLVGVVVALLLGLIVWLIPKQSKQSNNSKN